jgi:HTH-type transcriptional regulator/antitoxin HipB
LRQVRGLTQAELARRAGIHRIYLARVEGGTNVPALPTLERIAEALGLTIVLAFKEAKR